MNRVVQCRLFVSLLLLGLAGCATGQFDCTDLRQGACKASFARFGADTSATIAGPEGFSLSYSSAPNAAATAEAFAAINRLAGLVGTVAAGRLPNPVPFVPEPEDDEADGAAWTSREMPALRPQVIEAPYFASRAFPARSCPAFAVPRRVTASTPWMIEGVAHALDL